MSDLDGPLSELLGEMIPRVAAKVHRGYAAVPAEDIEQEMWLYALSHQLKMREMYSRSDEGIIWEELRRAGRRACKEDERYRRALRAAASGYETEDEQFYSLRVLRLLLPRYIDGGVTEYAPQGRDQGRSGRSDGSEHGDYLAIMLDLSRGLADLKPHQRNLLLRYFSLSQEDSEDGRWSRQQEASSMGLTVEALEMRVHRALVALQRELGGASPWPRSSLTYTRPTGSVGRTPRGAPSAARRQKLSEKE